MASTIMHRDGTGEDYEPSKIPALLAELDEPRDDEHSDIAVSHPSGWTLSAFQTGLVVWEDIEPGAETGPQHRHDIPRSQLPEIMNLVATGQLNQVHNIGWLPGYG